MLFFGGGGCMVLAMMLLNMDAKCGVSY